MSLNCRCVKFRNDNLQMKGSRRVDVKYKRSKPTMSIELLKI